MIPDIGHHASPVVVTVGYGVGSAGHHDGRRGLRVRPATTICGLDITHQTGAGRVGDTDATPVNG